MLCSYQSSMVGIFGLEHMAELFIEVLLQFDQDQLIAKDCNHVDSYLKARVI